MSLQFLHLSLQFLHLSHPPQGLVLGLAVVEAVVGSFGVGLAEVVSTSMVPRVTVTSPPSVEAPFVGPTRVVGSTGFVVLAAVVGSTGFVVLAAVVGSTGFVVLAAVVGSTGFVVLAAVVGSTGFVVVAAVVGFVGVGVLVCELDVDLKWVVVGATVVSAL